MISEKPAEKQRRSEEPILCTVIGFPPSENPTYDPDHQGSFSLTNVDNASITDHAEDLEAADPAFPEGSLQGLSQWMVAEPTPDLQLGAPLPNGGLDRSLLPRSGRSAQMHY